MLLRSERVIAVVAGAGAALVAALAPPEPFAPLRLLSAGLLAGAVALALVWSHRHAPLAAGAMTLAGLAVCPPPASLLWALLIALPALLALGAAYAERSGDAVHAAAPVAFVAGLAALLSLGLGTLLPRLSPGSGPLALLVVGLGLLGVGAFVAILRHGRSDDAAA